MIFTIIKKNLRIVFRNPFTIFLVVLAPIFLMLIVGFSYSSDTFNGVDVGLIETDKSLFNSSEKIRTQVNFIDYDHRDIKTAQLNCVLDLKKNHNLATQHEQNLKTSNTDLASEFDAVLEGMTAFINQL